MPREAALGIGPEPELEGVDPAPPQRPGRAARYEDLGLLAVGGMGEVRRVRDRLLGRVLAMKVLRADLASHRGLDRRLIAEARTAAQLCHAGIVAVHDVGHLPDGRAFYTMNEVRGPTLAHVLSAHQRGEREWPLARVVGVLRRVAEAMAHAHAHGVVHRDLKPANVMIGEVGEVVVTDWGLARQLEGTSRLDQVSVAGTPPYMAPELARGGFEQAGPAADVYALGAMLYELLAGQPAYPGDDPTGVLNAVIEGPPPVLQTSVDPELARLCLHAMARDPAERPRTEAVARVLAAWQSDAERVCEARREAERARELELRCEALRDAADGLNGQARSATGRDGRWRLEDQADRMVREAATLEGEALRRLHAALAHAPELCEAHALLAHRYRRDHARAEHRGDVEGARNAESSLRLHATALPPGHPDVPGHVAYLAGLATVQIATEPTGAEVELQRVLGGARRTLVTERLLGVAPVGPITLARGSYQLVLRAPGHRDVIVPLRLERGDRFHGAPTGDRPRPVPLPRVDELGPDEIPIPAGWTPAPVESRTWCEALVCTRQAVSLGTWLTFLTETGAEDRWLPDLAGVQVPRTSDAAGAPFAQIALPVVGVLPEAAEAFARWISRRDGVTWRLPTAAEWARVSWGARPRAATGAPWAVLTLDNASLFGVVDPAGRAVWCADPMDPERPGATIHRPIGADATRVGVHLVRAWPNPRATD